ncbi:hypothetical protein prwr041_16150 [Prevotella herbatica]|uniref:Uncharacterized protein n=1 Tax=Prevotella herbatica TaxID=2801997 RepID=A0ABN6EIF3_9BACT|nr:hypothetical protein prwr041_16150 [Prevotella herbatica]
MISPNTIDINKATFDRFSPTFTTKGANRAIIKNTLIIQTYQPVNKKKKFIPKGNVPGCNKYLKTK